MRGINHHEDFGWSNAPRLGSSPSGNTTTTQTSQPWSGEQGALENIYGDAGILQTSAVPQYYPNSTYAPLTDTQNSVMSSLIGAGQSGGTSGLQSADSNLSSTLSPDYTSGTSGAFGQGQGVLSNELSSSYLNPWNSSSFGNVVNNTLASAIPAATSSFIGGDRSDSGLASEAAAAGATNAVGNLAQSQYNTNQGIQNSAAQQASSNYLTQQGNQVKADALAPSVDQATMGDMSTALSTAGLGQENAQNQISADEARYNYNQELPWNQLGLYEGAITGTGNTGMSTSTTQPYFSNTFGNVASGVSGLLGLNALTGSGGSSFGSTALGGLGNWIWNLSDRNLKTDIKKIGESDSGFPLYTFRYKDDPDMSRYIGLMAQDVAKDRPDAVARTPFGLAVDYGKALE